MSKSSFALRRNRLDQLQGMLKSRQGFKPHHEEAFRKAIETFTTTL